LINIGIEIYDDVEKYGIEIDQALVHTTTEALRINRRRSEVEEDDMVG
jgi:hypothetical protein